MDPPGSFGYGVPLCFVALIKSWPFDGRFSGASIRLPKLMYKFELSIKMHLPDVQTMASYRIRQVS